MDVIRKLAIISWAEEPRIVTAEPISFVNGYTRCLAHHEYHERVSYLGLQFQVNAAIRISGIEDVTSADRTD